MPVPSTTDAAPSHRIKRRWTDRLKRLSPFGLGHRKPRHFLDMLGILWKNRDNLGYGWQVLSKGVCDGCALGVTGFKDWTIDGVHLCMTRLNLLRLNTMPALDERALADVTHLAIRDNAALRELGRLPYPMLRRQGEKGFHRISWEDALERIARRIRGNDPHRIAFYLTSRALTNEVYYVAQKAVRYMGSNNIDNAARLCHSPSTGAMKRGIGVAATTCSYRDWWGADLIVFFGANPANDQPVATKYLHEAKQYGSKVVMVNPYLEPGMDRYWVPSTASSALFGTTIADFWFPVAQGGDIAFLYGVLKVLLANDWVHREFVEKCTVGIDDLRTRVRQLDWAELEQQSGLKRNSMEEFAAMIRDARTAVLVWSMGITQHTFGGDAVSMILNLGLSQGFVGKDRCGLMPIRGHSGVQGGAEMGAYATAFPGGQPINEDSATNLSSQYGFEVPASPGLSATEMVEACARGELDLLFCAGGNFLRALPDPNYVAEAMANVPLRVHQDIILTDQMFIEPRGRGEEVMLLPAKTRYEQDDGGTETTTERRILFSPEIPRQLGEARAEWRIFRDLAATVDPERAALLGCESGQAIRDEIARVVPMYDGIQNLRASGDEVQYGGRHLCANGQFPTPDGKARFHPVDLPDRQRPDGMFNVSTRRGKQFNTLIYAERDPLNGADRDAVLMSAEDAARLHLRHNDPVTIRNEWGQVQGRVFLAPIAPRNIQMHWPEANVLLPRDRVDAVGGVPDYNAWVQVRKR